MKHTTRLSYLLMAAVAAVGIGTLAVGTAWAHCDTTGGPIIPEAKAALEKGDVTPILKWIKADKEPEIKAAFAQAVVVRVLGPEAKKLADHYFLETLVRVHRAGEGAPYTGIKDEPVEPIVAMADKTLAEGSAAEMIEKMNAHMAQAVNEKFSKALSAMKKKDRSVDAGREFVEAYVTYMHYVEGIHDAIMSTGGHQHTESVAAPSGHEQHQ